MANSISFKKTSFFVWRKKSSTSESANVSLPLMICKLPWTPFQQVFQGVLSAHQTLICPHFPPVFSRVSPMWKMGSETKSQNICAIRDLKSHLVQPLSFIWRQWGQRGSTRAQAETGSPSQAWQFSSLKLLLLSFPVSHSISLYGHWFDGAFKIR